MFWATRNFVQEWVAKLLGSALVDATSRDLGDAGRGWVVYVERSLRKEFLAMMVPDESMEHAVRVSQGAGESHLLPPVEGATVAAQERRALLFNDLQRLTPLLRRLMGEDELVTPSADRALHRSEWVGTGVQYFYDCHLTGFFTEELLPLLWDAILARGDHDFALAARSYLREMENQVGTFLGPGPGRAAPVVSGMGPRDGGSLVPLAPSRGTERHRPCWPTGS